MELYDEKLLLRGDVSPPDVRPQVVQPSKPARASVFQTPSPWLVM
ncbi:unnamed protein product [Spirodela intermedia]|uniref:Uncharacterized protein n=2 Tax=Spirodela intermedia TaxID=51605 RepID=A0A7I8J679_SPIIN|nr:unnamed protein product [Spirodela intermedia]CAA6665554.1 unnamed protein product [Spirodela intermedia]CAA7402288.1 unnamed protein product [Spirodela intermedia]